MTPLGLTHIMWKAIITGRSRGGTRSRVRIGTRFIIIAPIPMASALIAPAQAAMRSANTVHPCASVSPIRPPAPEELLLWFHHVPWDYRMRSGQDAVGRTGLALSARGKLGRRAAQGMGCALRHNRSGTPCCGGREACDSGTRRHLVARRLSPLFPDLLKTSTAGRVSKPQHTLEELKSANPLTGEPKQIYETPATTTKPVLPNEHRQRN